MLVIEIDTPGKSVTDALKPIIDRVSREPAEHPDRTPRELAAHPVTRAPALRRRERIGD